MTMVRAASVNDHPAFLETLAEVVWRTVQRYERGRPLPVVAGAAGAAA